MPKNDLSCCLEFCTHHSQTNQETPHGVLGIVGGVRLAVDAALVLGKFAEHGNEGAVGICIAVLFDREPWKFHLFIRRNDVQTVGLKSCLKKGNLVFADLSEIAQCMLREEIGWHLHSQAFNSGSDVSGTA